MFTCYVTPTEFYAAHDLSQFLPRERFDEWINTAANQVKVDLEGREINTSRLMVPVMLVGSTLYEQVTKGSDFEGSSVWAGNASRMVVEITSGSGTFSLEGTKDSVTYHSLRDVKEGRTMKVAAPGPGIYSMKFFEKYSAYRLDLETSGVTFTAYLVDSVWIDDLIMWKAIYNAIFRTLEGAEGRNESLYEAAGKRYRDLLNTFRSDYDFDESNSLDETETNAKPEILYHR